MSGEKTTRRGSHIALRRWVEGTALQSAWFEYASASLREAYENNINHEILSALSNDMKEDLCKGLRCGDLLAYGMSEGSKPDANPVRIPTHLFPIAGDQGPGVLDWEGSALSWPNGQFVRIRVTKPAVRALRRGGSRRDRNSSQKTNDNARPSPGKRGRFPVGEPLRGIVRALIAQGALNGKMRKEQVQLIRKLAREQYPHLFPRPTQPSQEKIYVALRAENLVVRPEPPSE
jgi:hypothetical protein